MSVFYAILSSENELGLYEINSECRKESWGPLCCKISYNEKPKIIIFYSLDVARSFARRNYSRKELVGVVQLPLEELDNFKDNGFEVETLNWPRIMKNSKEYKLGIEVVTLLDNPFVSVENGRI